jgi:hypothetical protein
MPQALEREIIVRSGKRRLDVAKLRLSRHVNRGGNDVFPNKSRRELIND